MVLIEEVEPEEEKEIKVDVWDGAAVRNALEDATKQFFNDRSDFSEDFSLYDTKLVICTVACLFSLFAIVYDYFIAPFPKSWTVLLVCAVSYYIMAGIYTLFTTFVEKNCFYVGKQKRTGGIGKPSKWRVHSSLPRLSDVFTLTMSFTDGETHDCTKTELSKSISCWFDNKGVLHKGIFFEDLNKMWKEIEKSITKKKQ